MRPTAVDMIRSIGYSLDADVVPSLGDDPRAFSTVKGIHYMLRHLAVRVEDEPQLLWEGNRDMRGLCRALVDALRTGQADDFAGWLDQRVADVPSAETGFPSRTRLAEENASLKDVVDQTIQELRRRRPELAPGLVAQLDQLISQQLARQIRREEACFDSTFTGHMW